MKMKYLMILALLFVGVGMPQADAAPKKKKKAKAVKQASEFDFDLVSESDINAKKEAAKAKKQAQEELDAIEDKRTGAERYADLQALKAETKDYIEQQRKTLKILKTVRDEKSAAKAVKPLEKIYGEVIDEEAASGTLTALGTVKILEEDEEKLPLYQGLVSVAATVNSHINKEINRISQLGIEHKKFNGAIKNMIDAQRL